MSVLWQWIETGRALGVDFVPRRVVAVEAASVPPPTAPPTDDVAGLQAPVDSGSALEELRDRYEREVVPTVTQHRFNRAVFGEGSARSGLMFIGEAPGADEDRTGRPFVGRAGQKLDGMINAIGLDRNDVYIANVVKIRPPENRNPLPDEIERDGPYLAEQIRLLRPRVIVALGGPATKYLLDTSIGITRLRGQWAEYLDEGADLRVPVMPTFHPAYLLRNYTHDTREKVWHDLQAVMPVLGQT